MSCARIGMPNRGFYGIGVEHPKTVHNVGTVWRTAFNLGAAFIFTIGRRYPKQASDTIKSWRHVPFYEYADLDSLIGHLPFGCQLVGVELADEATPLPDFPHPERACYLLGAEDHGLTRAARAACHHVVEIPSQRCLNVATAGAIVLYDRNTKRSALRQAAAA